MALTTSDPASSLIHVLSQRLGDRGLVHLERLDGRVFHDNGLPGLAPTERAAVFDAMNATLAALHARL